VGAGAAAEEAARPALEADHARAVRQALREVPDPYRTALRLRYWFDMPVAEIAESLGVAEGTAKSYLHRGRGRMLRVLKDKELLP
jgi:RNA polymerase sigma-70 factor (ECF subfamily)